MRCLVALTCLAAPTIALHRAWHDQAHRTRRDEKSESARSPDHNFTAVLQRMSYWSHAGAALAPTDKYLLFSPDAGGLNNIRIGMEMTAVVAQYTNRTLVLPPPSAVYLLDNGDRKDVPASMEKEDTHTLLESLFNLPQIKASVPTLTFSEFMSRTGFSWDYVEHNASRVLTEYRDAECSPLSTYAKVSDALLFMDGSKREGFSCGEWWQNGAPREEIAMAMGERGWALLDHGFVWTQSAFEIAAHVVSYLGVFDYNALHGRYGDFQFTDARTDLKDILKNWPSLLENGTTLYVSTDSPQLFQKFEHPGVQVFLWEDFFGPQTGHLLTSVKAKFSDEQWFKLQGIVEEIICTFSKLFVGTDRSSFSGHIARMREEADAPTKGHNVHMEEESVEKIRDQINKWEKRDGRWSFKPLPWDVGAPFLLELRAARSIVGPSQVPPIV